MATVKRLLDLTSPHWTFIAERPVYLALSGGKDSVVLLDALCQQWPSNAAFPLTLLHVNHHLQTQSDAWSAHCLNLAKRYAVRCQVFDVSVPEVGNMEANAREARYTALFSAMADDGVLLLAQHANDQVENLLLRLKRGAGGQGLSGMAVWQSQLDRFGASSGMSLFRPLLHLSQRKIDEYAASFLQINDWVEDPSNQDTHYDRNFLRHNVLPLVEQRWPQWTHKVAQSMQVLGQEHALLAEATNEKLSKCLRGSELIIATLTQYSPQWQNQLLRHYAQRFADVLLNQAQLASLQQIIAAKSDAQGQLRVVNQMGQEIHFYRFQSHVYCVTQASLDKAHSLYQGVLTASSAATDDLAHLHIVYQSVPLSYKIKPIDAPHRKPIKQWYQLWSIPPWLRPFTLIVQHNGHDELLWCNGVEYTLSKD